ncbi:Protein of uncharacterised function (DUF2569) [Serratia plymuthica]|nr:Protein of uncharacterised function (DUF2569) [Serratia plymuthica]
MDIERQQTTTDKEITLNKESIPAGLSGWLVLIAFHLIVMATVYGVSLLVIFFRPEIYFRLQHSSEKLFFILSCIAGIISIVVMVLALVAFFIKKTIFVNRYKLFIYSIILVSIVDCASLLWFHSLGYDSSYGYYEDGILLKKVIVAFVHPVFLICVCIPYLEKSKKVKEIFTR